MRAMTSRRLPLAAAGLVLLAVSLAPAAAQSPDKGSRIGYLGARTRAEASVLLPTFLQGLRDLGWVEGKNIVIEYRWGEGRTDRLPDLAAELVRLKVDVIFAPTTVTAVAARKATGTIPIVMATVGDPVGLGLVASLARPGGNVTGLSYGVGLGIMGKQLELLKEALPRLRRVAVLSNPANPSHALAIKEVTAAAGSLGVQLQLLEARGADDLDSAFAAMARDRAEALLVGADPVLASHRARLRDLAARGRLPAMYGLREHTEAGGLMSYHPDLRENLRRAATYVDKILRGARPAELPVEQPTKFDLAINLKAAKALGLTLPPSLLLRASEIIE